MVGEVIISTEQKVQKYLDEIEARDKRNEKINSFIYLNPHALEQAKEVDKKIKKGIAGKLAGQVISVKSNICVQGLLTSCASKTLEYFKAPYNATAIQKILNEDGVIIGMTNMDEFASGASGETSAYGPTKNPTNLELIPGGSSSGPAASVAGKFCDMALGTDTGGSIRNPASHCGIVGIKPTYGSVSRYGLIDLAMSLDCIGTFAKEVRGCAKLLQVIAGEDQNDSIMNGNLEINLKNIEKIPKKLVVGVIDIEIQNHKIFDLVSEKLQEMKEKYSWEIKKIKIDHIDLAIETYYPLVYVEAFSGTRKFDGRRYGKKIEDSVGPEFLRRILGGEEISQAEYGGRYYHQALKVKKLIGKEFEKAFKTVDCIICPTVPRLPHKIGEEISVEEMYSYDALTVPFSLAGNCAISIPAGDIEGIPIGMQIACNHFEDEKCLTIARSIEKL